MYLLACIGGRPFCDLLTDVATYVALASVTAAFIATMTAVVVARRKGAKVTELALAYTFWATTISAFLVGAVAFVVDIGFELRKGATHE